jgi:hypothetical protein
MEGGGGKLQHGAPLFRHLFAKDIKVEFVSVVTRAVDIAFLQSIENTAITP